MYKKCLGCGIELQNNNVLLPGFTPDLNNDYCERCFRLKHYGELKEVNIDTSKFDSIIKEIRDSKALVITVIDLINFDDSFILREKLSNKMILVINKAELFIDKEAKIIENMKNRYPFFEDYIMVSALKNYHLNELMNLIKKYKTSNKVYFTGYTNSGKSTLINKLKELYSDNNTPLVESILPGTTLDFVEVKVNPDLILIDTPGIISRNNIVNYVSNSMIKKILARKTIRPRNYQIIKGQSLIIEDIVKISYLEGSFNSFNVYMSNNLDIKRKFKATDELEEYYTIEIDVNPLEDLVIVGLCFIRIASKAKFRIKIINNMVKVYTRASLL